MKHLAFVIPVLLVLSACAGSSMVYTPPAKTEIPNTATIDDDFETTWSRLVSKLAAQYFVINNVEKESRIINVSFSVDEPSNYIDCGRIEREFVSELGQKQFYSYLAAKGSVSYMAMMRNPTPGLLIPLRSVSMQHKAKLRGRTNIYVAPKGADQTDISVNTRYIFDLQITGGLVFERYEIAFNTNNIGREEIPGGKFLECVSKGTIERDIIAAAQE